MSIDEEQFNFYRSYEVNQENTEDLLRDLLYIELGIDYKI